ncbi:DMT family transporter [Frigidibacter oleivorans]|uniref:DMT family transporter n=1 Tax=Frigidibacter oleivorans TaxID=2487129 RepID=UPI000F8EECDF|nr:DMT family transporter [Frigidibacter oleivorans]
MTGSGTAGNARGALFALAAMGVFSTHDAIIKTLGQTYSAFQIVFFAALLSFPLVTFLLINDRSDGNLIPKHPWWTALRTLCSVAAGTSAFYAYSVLPLAQVYALLFAAPLIVTVLAIPILGETVRLRRWLAVATGLAGVLIVLRPGGQDLTAGHAAALLSALAGATGSVVVRRIGRDERSVVLLVYPLMANFLVMAAAMPFVYVPVPLAHLGLWAVIAMLGLGGSLLLIRAYRSGEAVVVAPMQYSQILWATLYGYLLFGEGVDGTTILGTAVIVGSGIYIVLREGRSPASLQPVSRSAGRAQSLAPRPSVLRRFLPVRGGAGPV